MHIRLLKWVVPCCFFITSLSIGAVDLSFRNQGFQSALEPWSLSKVLRSQGVRLNELQLSNVDFCQHNSFLKIFSGSELSHCIANGYNGQVIASLLLLSPFYALYERKAVGKFVNKLSYSPELKSVALQVLKVTRALPDKVRLSEFAAADACPQSQFWLVESYRKNEIVAKCKGVFTEFESESFFEEFFYLVVEKPIDSEDFAKIFAALKLAEKSFFGSRPDLRERLRGQKGIAFGFRLGNSGLWRIRSLLSEIRMPVDTDALKYFWTKPLIDYDSERVYIETGQSVR